MRRPEIVNQIALTLHRIEPTADAFLYGSEARGDTREDSDIDLLILVGGERLTLSQDYNTVISRLYYACFYAIEALLLDNKIQAQPHLGIKTMFGLAVCTKEL